MSTNTIIISGFPGIGKSYLFNNNLGLKVKDSDSSLFSWIEKGVRHPDFPNNYISHIKECIGEYDVVLVSSHEVVRDALKESGLEYTIVYPSIELKEVYLKRYKERGNNEAFIELLENNWEKWITDIDNEVYPMKIKLHDDFYLSDYLKHAGAVTLGLSLT